jgi:STE24 endopeptidase
MFVAFIAPIYVAPLFNKYTRLDDPKVRDPILTLARANGIAVNNLYVMDASRQSTRISANVSGFLGSERITLNDNLLKRSTLPEIEAVMGALRLESHLQGSRLTPVFNTIVRTQEYEADIFGLNAAAQPDGFAQTALKLSEYRKLDPSPLEEAVLFDHPSGHTRILSAMRWKAEHARA